MIDANLNRLNFSEFLQPFAGYEMDYAIGTSYSLSLESLLFIPVTLFNGQELNPSAKVMTSQMLETLMKVPGKVRIFCQRGKILMPSFYHEILSFWEKSIEQIQMKNAFQSFHPKIWLIRYKHIKNRNDIRYRFICTSRNLTLSTDWDLAVCMEGTVDKKKHPENRPLLDFVKMLDSRAIKPLEENILKEILHIDFEPDESQIEHRFHPIGFSGYSHPLLAEDVYNEKLLIISPFLDTKTIEQHKKRSGLFSLYGLESEMDRIDPSALSGLSPWQLNPRLDGAVNTEPEYSENDEDTDKAVGSGYDSDRFYPPTSLHAKLYVAENKGNSQWFVGSANCTAPAEKRNIEFLTEIVFKHKKHTIREAEEQLTTASAGESFFIKYEPHGRRNASEESANDKDEKILRKLIFEISDLVFNATVEPNRNQRYDLCVVQETPLILDGGWEVGIRPLSTMKEVEQKLGSGMAPQVFAFKDFEEIRLTPFLLCCIYHDGLLCKQFILELSIDFPESRMKKIFSSIICNQERLLKYLNGILSKNDSYPLLELKKERDTTGIYSHLSGMEYLALYEKMLRAASRDKEKIKVIDQMLSLLEGEKDHDGKLIVSKELFKFLEAFRAFADDEI